MKKVIVNIIVLMLISCSNTSPCEKEYEDQLGVELVLGLNESVNTFEQMLEVYYQSQPSTSLYSKFLNDVGHKTLDWNKFYENTIELESIKEKVYQSGLYDELVYKYIAVADSTEGLIGRKYYYQPKHSSEPIDSITIRLDNRLDSIFKMEGGIVEYIDVSKLDNNMSCSEQNSIIIKEYLETKKSAGSIMPYLIAGGLLKHPSLKIDYFMKRIIVKEFLLYNVCKSIYSERNLSRK